MISSRSDFLYASMLFFVFYNYIKTHFATNKRWWNKESNEIGIKWFGLKIREKSLFQNQQNSRSNLGKMKNKIFKTKLTYQIKSHKRTRVVLPGVRATQALLWVHVALLISVKIGVLNAQICVSNKFILNSS